MFWMTKERVQRTRSADDDDDSELVFRIDKDELFGRMALDEEQPRTAVLRRRGR
jgi:hypothetical protein